MPRLNHGTLLENIVVFESARLCFENLTDDNPLTFASAFAMPPLTQCWSKSKQEVLNSPRFTHEFLLKIPPNPRGSVRQMWSLCIKNSPQLPVRYFRTLEQPLVYKSAGPNGALLAAMLAAQRGQRIDLWTVDDAVRYEAGPATQISEEPAPDTIAQAGRLIGVAARGSACDLIGRFPDAIQDLAEWLANDAGRESGIRVGFLDPDNYAEGETKVSSDDHQHWLRVLAAGCERVLSATFSGCQNRGDRNTARNERLAAFHHDEFVLYPHSVVFEYGIF